MYWYLGFLLDLRFLNLLKWLLCFGYIGKSFTTITFGNSSMDSDYKHSDIESAGIGSVFTHINRTFMS